MNGQQLMDLGKDQVEKNNKEWTRNMRKQARIISIKQGHVTTDDLHKLTYFVGHPKSHNAWGAVFRNKGDQDGKWVVVGYRKSERKEARARRISVWKWQYSSSKHAQVASRIIREKGGTRSFIHEQ